MHNLFTVFLRTPPDLMCTQKSETSIKSLKRSNKLEAPTAWPSKLLQNMILTVPECRNPSPRLPAHPRTSDPGLPCHNTYHRASVQPRCCYDPTHMTSRSLREDANLLHLRWTHRPEKAHSTCSACPGHAWRYSARFPFRLPLAPGRCSIVELLAPHTRCSRSRMTLRSSRLALPDIAYVGACWFAGLRAAAAAGSSSWVVRYPAECQGLGKACFCWKVLQRGFQSRQEWEEPR